MLGMIRAHRAAAIGCISVLLFCFVSEQSWAQTPSADISNGILSATIYTPDPAKGFYRATRFDWSGVIGRLEFSGHRYYGPWFTKTDPTVRDFVYRGLDIVAGPCSAVTGPAEEFLSNDEALGFREAQVGGTFVKIGVGVLRRPDSQKYDAFHLYEIVDHGKWSVRTKPDSVQFTQELNDPSSRYGYRYEKVVRLIPGEPRMLIEHTITNTGKRQIETSVYDHNFLVLDGQSTGPDFTVTLPFEILPLKPVKSILGGIEGNRIFYRKKLEDHEGFAVSFRGFGTTSKDYDIKIENKQQGAGMQIVSDRPLESEEIWSIRSVLAMEPYIHISVRPGQSFSWKYTYRYYSVD
jgi:hypothetical protein